MRKKYISSHLFNGGNRAVILCPFCVGFPAARNVLRNCRNAVSCGYIKDIGAGFNAQPAVDAAVAYKEFHFASSSAREDGNITVITIAVKMHTIPITAALMTGAYFPPKPSAEMCFVSIPM